MGVIYYILVISMAKPIAPTPVFEGEALEDLISYMKRPLTKNEKRFNKRLKNAKKIPGPSLDLF